MRACLVYVFAVIERAPLNVSFYTILSVRPSLIHWNDCGTKARDSNRLQVFTKIVNLLP